MNLEAICPTHSSVPSALRTLHPPGCERCGNEDDTSQHKMKAVQFPPKGDEKGGLGSLRPLQQCSGLSFRGNCLKHHLLPKYLLHERLIIQYPMTTTPRPLSCKQPQNGPRGHHQPLHTMRLTGNDDTKAHRMVGASICSICEQQQGVEGARKQPVFDIFHSAASHPFPSISMQFCGFSTSLVNPSNDARAYAPGCGTKAQQPGTH